MSRIEGMPIYEQQDAEVSATLYNLWRRAKLNFNFPMRLPLVDYRGLVMLLEEDAWVCVNERMSDLPVLAWIGFKDRARDALHLPVKCKLNHYHYAASKVSARSLELMEEVLEQRLHDHQKQ